eukprot:scaffold9215_cov44-Cyclotella_meneghiniana.AAC.1
MAGSLQVAAPTTPNPTNTLTNTCATSGGVGGVDSAAAAVKITAKAAHKWTDDASEGHFTSVGKDRGQRGHTNPHKSHNNQSGCGRG